MRVEFSKNAENDLKGIACYIAQDSLDRAISFTFELEQACLELTDFPDRFATYFTNNGVEFRRRPYGNYLIFYRIDAESIRIARILIAAQDIDTILGNP